MLNLLIAIDLEVKYWKLRAVDEAVDNIARANPNDMRRLFIYMYKAYPSKLLLEYEIAQREATVTSHHVAHAVVA